MTQDKLIHPVTVDRITAVVTRWISNLTFEPHDGQPRFGQWRILSFQEGRFFLSVNDHRLLLDAFAKRYPYVAEQTMEEILERSLLRPILGAYIGYEPGKLSIKHQITDDLNLFMSKSDLDAYIIDSIKRIDVQRQQYMTYVPLIGVEVRVDKFDFGPIKLYSKEYFWEQCKHNDLIALSPGFQNAEAIAVVRDYGDNRYVSERAFMKADVFAQILNLHSDAWRESNSRRQKIQVGVVSTFHERIAWTTTDPKSQDKPTNTVNAMTRHVPGSDKEPLDTSTCNMIKSIGFERIWNANFPTLDTIDEIETRIHRAVYWHDRAISFDESDAQFVGLAISLETLLVSKAVHDSLYATWSSISQQLADRCAYLVGVDRSDRIKIARQVKDYYDTRSDIVHNGGKPTSNQLREFGELVQEVILHFVQTDFPTFQAFEKWTTEYKFNRPPFAEPPIDAGSEIEEGWDDSRNG